MKTNKQNNSDKLLISISNGIEEVKGNDIKILDLKNIETSVCKYFVICSGSSSVHVTSIADNIKKYVSKDIKEKPWNSEGYSSSEWILLDYADIVVHVFQKQTRDLYNLEELWGDANIKELKN